MRRRTPMRSNDKKFIIYCTQKCNRERRASTDPRLRTIFRCKKNILFWPTNETSLKKISFAKCTSEFCRYACKMKPTDGLEFEIYVCGYRFSGIVKISAKQLYTGLFDQKVFNERLSRRKIRSKKGQVEIRNNFSCMLLKNVLFVGAYKNWF